MNYNDIKQRIINSSFNDNIAAPDLLADIGELVQTTQAAERQRCADIATAVFMNRGTCKHGTDEGKGWNKACSDIHHRITDPDAFLTQSPIPAMIQALQDVRNDALELHNGTVTPETLVKVIDALEQLKNPKEL